ncbi:MAG: dTMP kinase [Bacteroidetes bacterium]|nr:dTMP kinase [Bacteroidota bacterium]
MDPFQHRRASGSFIVLEGIDGSGTTTHAGLLHRHLVRHGRRAHCTREPSDGPIGSLIRLALSRRVGVRGADGTFAPLDETTLALAFAADRADHLRSEIIPSLENGEIVICDRYYLSSLAYQSAGADYGWLRTLNTKFLRPDLTVFLDVPPTVALERVRTDGRMAQIYENLERLVQVRAAYLRAIEDLRSEGEHIVVVSSDRPARDVHAEIVRLAEGLVPEAGPKG